MSRRTSAAILSIVLLALPASAQEVRLQALVATSGEGVERLLDPASSRGWKPEGDPSQEGVLFRFEEGTRVDEARVWACGDPGKGVSISAFVDGAYVEVAEQKSPDRPFVIPLRGRGRGTPLTLFVKLDTASCLSRVEFSAGGRPVRLQPPRMVGGRIEASSVLAPADAYSPGYLFDGRPDFGWVEGAKGPGLGERLTLSFAQTVEVSAVEIWNGYQRSQAHFQKNARAKRVEISVNGGPPAAFDLKDERGSQKLVLPAPAKADTLRITFRDVYRGTRYEDLVVSELRLWDRQGPFQLAASGRAQSRKALLAQIRGQQLARIVDRTLETEGPPGVYLRLRSDHSFVSYMSDIGYYDRRGYEWEEVLDGTWVIVSQAPEETVIELFGRRKRVARDWNPYAEGDAGTTSQTEQVSGGRLTITWEPKGEGAPCEYVTVRGRAIEDTFILPWTCGDGAQP